MILNKEGWYCFPEKIICIIKKNNVKHDNNFYCQNLESYKKVFQNNRFFGVVRPSESTKILQLTNEQQ